MKNYILTFMVVNTHYGRKYRAEILQELVEQMFENPNLLENVAQVSE
jgi:hypothetical protein